MGWVISLPNIPVGVLGAVERLLQRSSIYQRNERMDSCNSYYRVLTLWYWRGVDDTQS